MSGYALRNSYLFLAVVILLGSGCASEQDLALTPPLQTEEEAAIGGAVDESSVENEVEKPLEQAEPDAPVIDEGEQAIEDSSVSACPDPDLYQTYDQCCDLGEAYCLPSDTIPEGLNSQLDGCGAAGSCVPGIILNNLSAHGVHEPKACESLGGKDGVCLSMCIPKVREVMALLPQDICDDTERCTPCIDPLTGEETGACTGNIECDANASDATETTETSESAEVENEEVSAPPQPSYSCDMPPDEALVDVNAFGACCEGAHCVPKSLVPEEEHDFLSVCDGDAGFCVPDPMVESGGFFVPQTCESVGGVEGRCLSTCLPNVAAQESNLPVDICGSNERCAPCCDPFTGESTGACDRGCDTGPETGICEGPIYDSCCSGLGHCIEPELLPEDKLGNVEKCKGENKGLVCVPDEMHDPNYAGEACIGQGLMGSYQGVCLPDCLKIFLKIALDDANCAAHHKCVPCEGLLGKSTGAPGCPQ